MAIGIVALIIYPLIIEVIYADRVTGYHFLIYIFVFIHTLLLIESLPKAYLVIRLPVIGVFNYTTCLIIGGVIGLMVAYLSSPDLGITSIALGAFSIIIVRLTAAYYFTIRDIKNRWN